MTRKIEFELEWDDESGFHLNVVKGNVPHHVGLGISDPEAIADYDHCLTPGDVLRTFADALDTSMARAWWDTVPETTGPEDE